MAEETMLIKRVSIALLVVALVLAGYLIVVRTHFKSDNFTSVDREARPVSKPGVESESNDYVADNTVERPNDGSTADEADKTETIRSLIQNEIASMPDTGRDNLVSQYPTKEELSARNSKLKNDIEKLLADDVKNLSEHLNRSFDEEGIDSDWAYDYESALYEAITKDQTLSLFNIENIKCKTTRCKIALQLDGSESFQQTSVALMTRLTMAQDNLRYGEFISNYDVESNTAEWFIGRNKYIDLLSGESISAK